MTNTPKDPDKLPEQEADARFNKLVGNLVNTPHKPHGKPSEKVQSRGAADRKRGDSDS
jgi:hypothetical protein